MSKARPKAKNPMLCLIQVNQNLRQEMAIKEICARGIERLQGFPFPCFPAFALTSSKPLCTSPRAAGNYWTFFQSDKAPEFCCRFGFWEIHWNLLHLIPSLIPLGRVQRVMGLGKKKAQQPSSSRFWQSGEVVGEKQEGGKGPSC